MPKPIVAIVGRPNVGKSTLFNRLVGRRLAIVEERPGTTRDRLYADAEWRGKAFTLVDTGGLEITVTPPSARRKRQGGDRGGPARELPLTELVRLQAEVAIAEADVIIFLVDAAEGLTAGDIDIAEVLRRSQKPVFLAPNKAESRARQDGAVEFYELGLGDPLPISALHGIGIGDLLDLVVASFPPAVEEKKSEAVKIAIVGRPNVGKSLLLNCLLREERVIVSEVPGTTRDAIDTSMTYQGVEVVLIDTAGIRRRGKIAPGVEKYSVLRALKAISRADVACLLLDATELAIAQDAHIAGYIIDEGKSVVVIVNKWDLVKKEAGVAEEVTRQVRASLRFLDYVLVLFVSAKTGQGVDQILPTALRVQEERLARIPTAELNHLLQEAVARHAPPSRAGKRLKLYYATQADVDPPTFVFFVNDPSLVHFSYERYLENVLRAHYEFMGTPIRLSFRQRRGEGG
jgi:GTP-binding protein